MKEKLSLEKRSPKLCVILASDISARSMLTHHFDVKPPEETTRHCLIIGKPWHLSGACSFFLSHPVAYSLEALAVINTGHYGAYLFGTHPMNIVWKDYYPPSYSTPKAVADIIKRCTRLGELIRVMGDIKLIHPSDDSGSLAFGLKMELAKLRRTTI